jgi:hypothetical protein
MDPHTDQAVPSDEDWAGKQKELFNYQREFDREIPTQFSETI